MDWTPLLRAAGFDPAALTPSAPRGVPPHYASQRAAWDGRWPDDSTKPAHIEAAAADGAPVWFEVTGPWDADVNAEQRLAFSGPGLAAFLDIAFAVLALVVALLGWHNIRQRRGDRGGALRLAAVVLALGLAQFFLAADYNGNVSHQFSILAGALRTALVDAAIFGALYIALEPNIRRRWPDRLIAWSRLLAGDVRNPMVGRDVLIGTAAGLAHVTLAGSSNVLPSVLGLAPPGVPHTSNIEALLGIRHSMSLALYAVSGAMFWGLIFLVALAAFTLALRRRWLAGLALYLIQLVGFFFAAQGNRSIIASSFIIAAIWTVVIVRYGFLAIAAAQAVFNLMFSIPNSLDLSAWYAPSMAVPIVATIALALYGFRTALGGQRALPDLS
jgi:hypothetical protein